MSDATTGGKVAEGTYTVSTTWTGKESGRWVRLWREAIVPNLYRIESGEVVWAPEREDAIHVIGPIRSAGFRLTMETPRGAVPLRHLVSVYLMNANRSPGHPRGAVLFRWPKRADMGNPAYGVEPAQASPPV
jgi:hypothetical protein